MEFGLFKYYVISCIDMIPKTVSFFFWPKSCTTLKFNELFYDHLEFGTSDIRRKLNFSILTHSELVLRITFSFLDKLSDTTLTKNDKLEK